MCVCFRTKSYFFIFLFFLSRKSAKHGSIPSSDLIQCVWLFRWVLSFFFFFYFVTFKQCEWLSLNGYCMYELINKERWTVSSSMDFSGSQRRGSPLHLSFFFVRLHILHHIGKSHTKNRFLGQNEFNGAVFYS